jgi:Tol biopolymer transport system component
MVCRKPRLVVPSANDGDADWTPLIAPDESYFIFCSFRKGGFGSGDLYISFKQADGSWGDVINMGDRINTDLNERFPIVTPDGKYLFFNSTRKIAGAGANEPGNGAGDVYWIAAKIIEELRAKARLSVESPPRP